MFEVDDYPHNDGEHPCTNKCCEPWTEADDLALEERLDSISEMELY